MNVLTSSFDMRSDIKTLSPVFLPRMHDIATDATNIAPNSLQCFDAHRSFSEPLRLSIASNIYGRIIIIHFVKTAALTDGHIWYLFLLSSNGIF